jgi:FlaA1/EpsC-like NDP-sugar epimerase
MNVTRLGELLLSLPRASKQVIAFTCDALTCSIAMFVAIYLRIGQVPDIGAGFIFSLLAAPIIALPIFYFFGLYRAVYRHAGLTAMKLVAYAVASATIPTVLIFTIIGVPGVPRTVGLIQPTLLLLFVLLSRLVVREWFGQAAGNKRRTMGRAAIYGAGSTGRQLALALSASHELLISTFIDDNPALQGKTLNGIPIKSLDQVVSAVKAGVITDILLAMPTSSRQRRNEIIAALRGLSVRVRTLPAFSDLAQGRDPGGSFRELDIDDLLNRVAVAPDSDLLIRTTCDKVVMVTGAGGSIGSELCRQIIKLGASKLLLVEQNEFALYQIHSELISHAAPEVDIIPLLASVTDRDRIAEIVASWSPETIFHAAAYKHVPLVEHNVIAGIVNNVFGTKTVADIAREAGVRNFVLISTDKAVRPTNIMGATKRLAEIILQIAALEPAGTCFSMVRFGNVLNSSGSVVPLFRKQIANGGPITITHPDITRYFMTIPEAAQLVIQASGLAVGGEVFVLDMGEPVKIYHLACDMISLSGLQLRSEENPHGDISIEIVGLRPGEKLYEELLIGNNPMPTEHDRIMKANEPIHFTVDMFSDLLDTMMGALSERNVNLARSLLVQLVHDYKPSAIVDWVYTSGFNGLSERNSEEKRPELRTTSPGHAEFTPSQVKGRP